MLKQKFLKLLLIFPALNVLTSANPANAKDFFGIGGALTNAIADIFSWLANMISDILFDTLLTPILILVKNNSNLLLDDNIAQSVWTGSLTVANSLFLLALVFASVAIILRFNVGTYNLKKVLGGFITAVILSNLSLLIVRIFVELGDNLELAAYGLFSNIKIGETYLTQNKVNSFIIALTGVRAPDVSGGVGLDNVGAVLLGIIIMVLIFWVLLKLTLVLVERMFWIFLMAVAAPIIFALNLLPTMQKYAADWWTKLIKWILVLPLVAVILSIAAYFLMLAAGGPDADPVEFIGSLTGKNTFRNLFKDGNTQGLFLIIGLIILYQAGRANNLLGIDKGSISGAVDTPKKTLGSAQGAIKTGKSAYKFGADTATGKNLLGKVVGTPVIGARRLSGQALNKGGNWLAKGQKEKSFRGRLKNLGTQAGNITKYAARGIEARKLRKAAEANEDERSEKEAVYRRAQKQAKSAGREWLQPEGESRLLKGNAKNIYSEINSRSSAGFENDTRSLENAKTAEEYIINMGIMSKAATSQSTPKAERDKYANYINTYKKNPALAKTWKFEKERQTAKPLYKFRGFDSSPLETTQSEIPKMVASMRAKQNAPKYKAATAKSLDKLTKDEFELMKQIASGDKGDEAKARTKLDDLGVTNINEQNKIISAGRTEEAKNAINDSSEREKTKAIKRDHKKKGHDASKKSIGATIDILTNAQDDNITISNIAASQKSTVQHATTTIENNINNGSIKAADADDMSTEADRILEEVAKKLEQNPNISGTDSLNSLGLKPEDLEDIKKTLARSGLVVGQNLDNEDQINNATADTVLSHLSTIREAGRAAYDNKSAGGKKAA